MRERLGLETQGQPPLSAVPVTWDETRVLGGRPGEYITVARRSAKDWYLGSISDWNERELNIPLEFLASGKFTAEIYADRPTPRQSSGLRR